ncbi:MAG TPA: hypothetical protein VH592_26120, partial [Gemmataceae bacterium]
MIHTSYQQGIGNERQSVSILSHPEFIAALAVAVVAAWNALAGRSHSRSRTTRPIVKALHCQRPLFS